MYDRQNPFLASIKERYFLSKPGSEKNTHHVVLDLKGSGITYSVGDSLAIIPSYDLALVNKTLHFLKTTGQEMVNDRHTGQEYTFRDFISQKCNISSVSRKILHEIAVRQTHPDKKEKLDFLLQEDEREGLKSYLEERELWDIFEENEEVSFTPAELTQLLQPMLPRFYSIASSMKVVGEEVHLTVSYVKYVSNGAQRLGVCSHFLCDMLPLHQPLVPIYVHSDHGFTLPADDNADIILIGPGTGVAPYRAFLQERSARKATGKNWLFFGEWRRNYDFFYEDEWKKIHAQVNLRVDTAFSRDQEGKFYVQHRMLECGEELWKWMERGAYVYVCGDARHMAKDVDAILHEIVQHFGKQDAKAFMKKMRADKKYLRDVY